MKNQILFLMAFLFLFFSCQPPTYYSEQVENPPFRPNTVFRSFEDLKSSKFAHLRNKYQLDTVFHGETDEFKRILLLRHWIKSVIKIEDHGDPYPGDGYVEGILDAALKGTGFHCGHFMKVQNGVMNAYGYVTRTLGAGAGGTDGVDGHHGINEIWLNGYDKWFLSDAKYDHHFEKNGIPLSALEVRDEFLKNRAADIIMVKGPDRTPIDFDEEIGRSKEEFARTYTWIEWHAYNNMFTVWPDFQTLLIMYDDDYFRNHTWIWGGKPHWAYNTEYLILVKDRDAIEWTPNTIESQIQIQNKKVYIALYSNTPNLKTYQIKYSTADEWVPVNDTLALDVGDNENTWVFRTLNLAGVSGPEHRIVIKRK